MNIKILDIHLKIYMTLMEVGKRMKLEDQCCSLELAKRLKELGVSSPIIPGVLPITDYPALVRFSSMCGASIPQEVHDIFKPIAENPEKTLAAGIDFCLKQCRQLLQGGAPGLHFYALNKIHPVDVIIKELRP